MKKWMPETYDKKDNRTFPEPVVVPDFPPVIDAFSLECLECEEKAKVLFEGASYCRIHLKERLRTRHL